MRQVLGICERLHRRLPKTVLSRMGPIFIVLVQPPIHVGLQMLQAAVQLLAERDAIKLILHGPMEPFANAVGLR